MSVEAPVLTKPMGFVEAIRYKFDEYRKPHMIPLPLPGNGGGRVTEGIQGARRRVMTQAGGELCGAILDEYRDRKARELLAPDHPERTARHRTERQLKEERFLASRWSWLFKLLEKEEETVTISLP